MRQHSGALHVPQEVQSQALAFAGSRDQTGYIGHGEHFIAHAHHTEVRHQRGERVIGNLRLCSREHGDERGLARGGEAHQAHVRHGLELQGDFLGLAGLTQQGKTGSLASLGDQRGIAQTTMTAFGHDHPGAHTGEVSEHLSAVIQHHGAFRYGKHAVFTAGTVPVIARAIATAASANVRVEVKVQQRVDLCGDLEDDISAVATVTAVWAAQWHELLSVNRGTAMSSVASLQVQGHAVNELRHEQFPFKREDTCAGKIPHACVCKSVKHLGGLEPLSGAHRKSASRMFSIPLAV